MACGGSGDSSGGSDDSSNESVADSDDSSGGSVADSADDSSMMMVMDRTTRAQESLEEAGVDLDLDELEETVTGFSTGDGDGTDSPSASVSVSVGQTELFGSGPEDQPRYYAESNVYDQSLTCTLDGGRMMGSGEMTDRNDYENYDKSYPVTFEASCS